MKLISRTFVKALLFDRSFLVLSLLPFILGFLLYYPTTMKENNFSVCLMVNITHHPCPSCGLSRSFAYLMHGRIIEAFQYNWLLLPFAALFLTIVIVQLLPAKLRIKIYRKLGTNMPRVALAFRILIIGYFVFGILRILDMHLNFIGMENVVPDKTILRYIMDVLK